MDDDNAHGLAYPDGMLDALPAHPAHPQVRVLKSAQFAALHAAHILAHPPDGVLFPFLHGLEGDNHAQNTFFAAPTRRHPPRFRGLVWVVCDDDLDGTQPLPVAVASSSSSSEEDDDEEFSDEDDDEDEDELLPMDVDTDVGVRIVRGDDLPPIATLEDDKNKGTVHMHPVHHRVQMQLQTAGLPMSAPEMSTSSGTDGSFFSTPSTDVPMTKIALPPPAPSSSTSSSSSSSSSSPAHAHSHPPQTASQVKPDMDHVMVHDNENGNEQESESESDNDPARPPLLTCTFRPRELLRRVGGVLERPPLASAAGAKGAETDDGEWEFRPARVPDGISLRNFGIQVSIYATLSDIVVYSPKGLSSPALGVLADRFACAIRRKRAERRAALGPGADADAVEYNVFVLDADARTMRRTLPELMMRVFEGGERREQEQKEKEHAGPEPNTVDFGQRERDEMRELTRASEIVSVFGGAGRGGDGRYPITEDGEEKEDLSNTTTVSHWRPLVGQVFLGNSGDVPLSAADGREEPFCFEGTNDPREGMGYDVCVECHEMAPFPSLAHLRAAEEHLTMLDSMWDEHVRREGIEGEGRIRPPPNANAVIHLPFPSAPPNTTQTINALLPVIAFLERCLRPVPPPAPTANANGNATANGNTNNANARRWSTLPSAPTAPAAFFPTPPVAPRTRSLTSPSPSPSPAPKSRTLAGRTRPLKVLIYSSDGYTESSPLALSLLMAVRHLSLPEAYLELQVTKRRSFFVYPGELGLLRRVEGRIGGADAGAGTRGPLGMGRRMSGAGAVVGTGSLGSASGAQVQVAVDADAPPAPAPYVGGSRPAAKSVSFAPGTPGVPAPGGVVSPPMMVPSQGMTTRAGRPRARTSPWLPSFGDHQSWFNDPRFDGSFPSRVLPFLYLGNLNHASNAYMLHALGITHVVSVGECALVPPPLGHCTSSGDTCTSALCRPNHNTNAHFIQGKGPGNQGSLWIEEREGRIKVLDIKGVCDDGIDTLEPQLEPICEWIEKARLEGGQVLVHCRVGVSRSATVTIAYVMKHLSMPLVDAYLIVRSRRLSVLIQPNMRLLYNLCGWEIKLAKERAGEDARRLRKELARTLTWPYLSKEVHALNEKYLH
ncbi:hypothetical protein B0H10DRAFT_2023414 [Mycena sp. CBHHK59/15]|nr:hypothetical protein B0H10DRAFT_2023414 [Mycena sp. CBHHK59/15]